jgi:hypothetical protein
MVNVAAVIVCLPVFVNWNAGPSTTPENPAADV